jgi:hypothetical protein
MVQVAICAAMNYVQPSFWNAENAVYEGSFTFYCVCVQLETFLSFERKREATLERAVNIVITIRVTTDTVIYYKTWK